MHINESLETINTNKPFIQPVTITVVDVTYEETEDENGEIVTKTVETKREEESYITHPPTIFRLWNDAELAVIGVYRVQQEPIPEGFFAAGWGFEIVGDYAIGVPTLEANPEPEVVVPQIISFAQGKRALIRRGHWQAVNDFVDAIEDETERLLAQSALNDPTEFHRTSPFLNYLAGVLGIPDSEIDEMFIEGSADII